MVGDSEVIQLAIVRISPGKPVGRELPAWHRSYYGQSGTVRAGPKGLRLVCLGGARSAYNGLADYD
jgi:hypothetical protein